MKKLFLSSLTILLSISSFGQDIWTIKDSVNGPPRSAGATFNANGDGFVCGGFDGSGFTRKAYSYTLWQDDWDDEVSLGGLNFDGLDRASASGFSLNNKGYICLGQGESNGFFGDLWEYDAVSNTWAQKADFAGTPRREAVAFSIDNKAYVGTGQDQNGLTRDFYAYDPVTNTWSQISDFGGTARKEAVGFTMGGQGYVGTGDDGVYKKDFWQYEPTSDQWIQKADFPGTARKAAVGWGMFPQGFIATGEDINFEYKKDVWEYNYFSDSWVQRSDFMGPGRSNAIAFVIDYLAFVGMGYNSGTFYDDFYSYNRIIGIEEIDIHNKLKAYPNPATEYCYLEGDSDPKSIEMYDMHGKNVTDRISLSMLSNKVKLNIQELNAGIYYISGRNAITHVKFVSKIIVQ